MHRARCLRAGGGRDGRHGARDLTVLAMRRARVGCVGGTGRRVARRSGGCSGKGAAPAFARAVAVGSSRWTCLC